jgi:hypothetical protein
MHPPAHPPALSPVPVTPPPTPSPPHSHRCPRRLCALSLVPPCPRCLRSSASMSPRPCSTRHLRILGVLVPAWPGIVRALPLPPPAFPHPACLPRPPPASTHSSTFSLRILRYDMLPFPVLFFPCDLTGTESKGGGFGDFCLKSWLVLRNG